MENEKSSENVTTIIQPKSSLTDKIKSAVAVTVLTSIGFGAGYIGKDIVTPRTDFNVKNENGIEYLVNENQSLQINSENGIITLGDKAYQIDSFKKSIQNNYLSEELISITLKNSENIPASSIDQVLELIHSQIQTSQEFADDVLYSSLLSLDINQLTDDTRNTLVDVYIQLGERNPSYYDSMGDNFKDYARTRIVNDFLEQVKKDSKNVMEDIKETDTYQNFSKTSKTVYEKTTDYLSDRFHKAMDYIKEKVGN